MIELCDISAGYGRVNVLHDVNLQIESWKIGALLGANGAGKSTLLHSVIGLHREMTGKIIFNGQDVSALDAAERTRRGMSLVPAGRQVFPDLTVRQNLILGLHGTNIRSAEREDRINEVIKVFPILNDFKDRRAGLLSGGQQQMLAIARALIRRPTALLLDEPSLGLAPQIVTQILAVISQLTKSGMGVLLAEQNAVAALGVSQQGAILENGALVRNDKAEKLLDDPEVGDHYLGTTPIGTTSDERPSLPTSIFEPMK
jgi:branched-chain amino acid transport system ATP-binding protein